MQKKCEYCDQLFPVDIMNEHHQVCDKKKLIPNNGHIHRENILPNFGDYQYSDEEENEDEEINHLGNLPAIFNFSNRRPSRGRSIRVVNGRTII